MRQARIISVLVIILILGRGAVHSQDASSFKLSLDDTPSDGSEYLSRNFQLSLGSQVMHDDKQVFPAERFQILSLSEGKSGSLALRNPKWSSIPAGSHIKSTGHRRTDTGVHSTLTLNNSFLSGSGNAFETLSGKPKVSKRVARWAVYGEFSQERIPQPQVKQSVNQGISANILPDRLSPGISRNGSADSAIYANKYYLEAEYDFLPSFKGRVSYNRSVIETFDQQEKLQVEGTVEANPNVLIKAGYKNETLPEVGEPKSTKDTKVWTEFILKF